MAEARGGSGIGIVGILGVLFVGLKLFDVISWSWWWVTLPFWGGLAFAVVAGAFLLVIAGIVKVCELTRRRRRTLGMRDRS